MQKPCRHATLSYLTSSGFICEHAASNHDTLRPSLTMPPSDICGNCLFATTPKGTSRVTGPQSSCIVGIVVSA